MSIVSLKKINVILPLEEKDRLLGDLQSLGVMHLNTLCKSDHLHAAPANRADDAYKALRFLKHVKQRRKQVTRDPEFNVTKITRQALKIKQAIRECADKRDFLRQRIRDIRPWGDIYFPPHQALRGYRLWFYVLPVSQLSALKRVDIPWQIVSRDIRFAYVTLIAKQEPPTDILPVERTHLGALPLNELQYRLDEAEVELEELRAQRQALTRYYMLLQLHLVEADNLASLEYAKSLTKDINPLCVVQGWVPAKHVSEVVDLVSERECAITIESTSAEDAPPTLLDQPTPLASGVELANFYQVPAYRSWDPSKLLLASFSLFFAMILADAGYAVVLLLILAFYYKRARKTEKGKAYFLLGTVLCVSTLVYGMLVGSYFGLSPGEGHPLASIAVLDLNDFDSMMRLSILIGVVHILVANAMQFIALRRFSARYVPIGWSIIILAGFTLWQFGHDAVVEMACYASMVLGALMIVMFSDTRPVTSVGAFFARLAKGGIALTGVMGAFGDILSYMRLFALGLASASLAVTFNQLASDVYATSPGMGLLGAILIMLIGHALNLLLSIISGVVHGLRLNFIEFYKWGLPDEGYPFQHFAKKEIDND